MERLTRGDEEMICNSCEVLYVNGIKTHEPGCPDAWLDYLRECDECGCQFQPEYRYQTCCSDSCYGINDTIEDEEYEEVY
jgi:hypothetical protein